MLADEYSTNRSKMLDLAIQPPAQARPGVALYPPLTARLSSEYNIFEELSQVWAAVTLVHHSGEVLYQQLSGKVADSAHPLPEGGGSGSSSAARDRAYFYFPDLVIHEPGQYRVRVTLMQMDYSCDAAPDGVVTVREYVDSRSISIENNAPNRSRPNSRERAFLRVLRDDGQQIPSGSG
ncbi:hypothetical protein LAWI1_G002396 [Lachnellula willkommii]|uniref:Velvet domain-containing protein n=2 Tax=Lachnellula TaxID=47830 RepID=A0A559MJE8_9HELO|nr:hypothetical protein LAWI1_G002396 [Lachnellula willkommii]